MAVLSIEIFLRAPETTDPASHPTPEWLTRTLAEAITPLTAPGSAMPVIGATVDAFPDGDGAQIRATCLAADGVEAMDTLAARLEAALIDFACVEDWHLHAGQTNWHSADN